MKTKTLTRIAILSAVAIVLSKISIPMVFGHLKIDPALIPGLIGGFLINPFAGVCIEIIKNIISLFDTTSAGIGELINLLVGTSLILPTCFVYKKTSNFIISGVVGLVSIITIGALCNYIFTPAYLAVLGLAEPTHTELMGFVTASLLLNFTKALVTLIPVYFILPTLEKIK